MGKYTAQYTNADKRNALNKLRYNNNNIALTSRQLGIDKRTLTKWYKSDTSTVDLQAIDLQGLRDAQVAANTKVDYDVIARFAIDLERCAGKLIKRLEQLLEDEEDLDKIARALKVILDYNKNSKALESADERIRNDEALDIMRKAVRLSAKKDAYNNSVDAIVVDNDKKDQP